MSRSAPSRPSRRASLRALRAALPALLLLGSACADDPVGTRAHPAGPLLGLTGSTAVSMGNLGENPVTVHDMNDAGQVVGISRYSGTSPSLGFYWKLGQEMRDVPGEPYCSGNDDGCDNPSGTAMAINNAGTVTGWATRRDAVGRIGGYRWSESGGEERFPNGVAYPSDINEAGDVVGTDASGTSFIWSGAGTVTYLPALPGAFKVNEAGEVLGRSATRGYIWRAGGAQDLGTLGGTRTTPTDLNVAGQVVGTSELSGNSVSHAFLWSPAGGMRDLGTLGGTTSQANAVNAAGQVVGWSTTAEGNRHAFRWTPEGGMEDLGILPGLTSPYPGDPPTGPPISEALDINDAGDVTGFSDPQYESPSAFIWTEAGGIQALGYGVGMVINENRQVAGVAHLMLEGGRFWHNIVTQSGPVVNAGGPYAANEGEPILFDGTGTTDPEGDDMTFAWDFNGDGTPDSAGVQVSYTFAGPGSFTVRLFATDESGVTRNDDAAVTIGPTRWPSAVVVLPPGSEYGEGSRIVFSSAGSASEDGGRLLYRWEFGDGTYAQSEFRSTPYTFGKTYGDQGTYPVRLIAWDTMGRTDTAAVQVVVRNTAPVGDLRILSAVYENGSVPLQVISVYDSAVADRRAGFSYAFDCGTGSGFGAYAASAAATCPARPDNGAYSVGTRIRDKDGGVREVRRTLSPINVRPRITGLTWAGGVLTAGFADPGTNDAPWTWVVRWRDGTRSEGRVSQQGSAAIQVPHGYTGPGPYTALVHVYDKDGMASPVDSLTITP